MVIEMGFGCGEKREKITDEEAEEFYELIDRLKQD